MNELVTLFVVHEVGQSLGPSVLELYKDVYKFYVVLELRINYFNVLLIFLEKVSEV